MGHFRLGSKFVIYFVVTDMFKQVAKTVTDVHLSDNVVDVAYKMFDENGNWDTLSYEYN